MLSVPRRVPRCRIPAAIHEARVALAAPLRLAHVAFVVSRRALLQTRRRSRRLARHEETPERAEESPLLRRGMDDRLRRRPPQPAQPQLRRSRFVADGGWRSGRAFDGNGNDGRGRAHRRRRGRTFDASSPFRPRRLRPGPGRRAGSSRRRSTRVAEPRPSPAAEAAASVTPARNAPRRRSRCRRACSRLAPCTS